MAEVKSAIREVRDQLFLNRADGSYLSNVGANIGFERPQFGFHNDDLWRAVVRRGALDYLQIVNLFEDWLAVIFGPRRTVATILAEEAVALEETFLIVDPTNIPQRGTMIIDEGLLTQQTFEYGFRNPETGLVELSVGIATSIPAFATKNASGYLRSAISIGATSLPLVRSVDFPEANFPFTILLSPGTAQEEVVQLTGHNTVTQTLTCSATANAHPGPKATFVMSALNKVEGGGTVITLGDTSNFPATGMIRIKELGLGGVEDVVSYYSNDVDAGVLYLHTKLTNVYTLTTASVTLLRSLSLVQLAQVQVKGSSWDIFETEARKIKIYILEDLTVNRLIDVTYLHGAVDANPASTVDTSALVGDKVLKLVDAATFPSAGVIKIDAGGGSEEKIGYARIDRFSTTLLGGGAPATATEFYVQSVAPLAAAAELTKNFILSRGLGAEEVVAWSALDPVTNKVTLQAATVNTHLVGATVEVEDPNVLHLTRGLVSAHAGGETVALDSDEYAGTDLEIGDPTVAPANTDRFQGSYLSSVFDRARDSQAATTLAEDLAGPVGLLADQTAGSTTLEVRDATFFDTTGQFDITVGRRRGSAEDIDVTGITFRRDAVGMVLAAGFTAGDSTFSMSAPHIALLPNPGGGAPMGFRLLIDAGGANEEIVIVEDHSGTVVTLLEACTKSHLINETVELLADVFELSEPTEYDHYGMIKLDHRKEVLPGDLRADRRIHRIEELRTSIEVVATTGFPATGGYALVNFGREQVIVRNKLASALVAAGTSVVLESSDDFPVAGYPYFVEIDLNTNLVERKGVTNNNPGTETLTISPGADFDHPAGVEVRFDPGEPVTLAYTGLAAGPARLTFAEGLRLEKPLLKGVPVILSSVTAKPSTDGFDYPVYLPSTWAERLQLLFDRGRAAGVEVVTISSK